MSAAHHHDLPAWLPRVVDAAMTAPSGDNCQPFRYRWDRSTEVLSVVHDADRARHRMNVGGHASLLTLGCLIEAIDLACSAEGLAPGFQRRPAGDTTWMDVRFEAANRSRDGLHTGLPLRSTDRRPFRGGDLGDAVFAEVRRDAERSPCGLYLAGRPDAELEALMLLLDEVIWRDEATGHDALAWVRFSDIEVQRSRDGMSWRNLGISLAEARASELIVRMPALLRVVRLAGAMRATKRVLRRQLRTSAGLLLLTVDAPGHDGVIEAGRLALRAWIRLSMAGYAAQPLSLPSLCVYNRLTGVLPDDLPADLLAAFDRAPAALAESFAVPRGQLPVWMLRVGRNHPLPGVARALRLRRDWVFDVV